MKQTSALSGSEVQRFGISAAPAHKPQPDYRSLLHKTCEFIRISMRRCIGEKNGSLLRNAGILKNSAQ